MGLIRIGISLGDVTGIGPEVTLKALSQQPPSPDTCYVLIGDQAGTRALHQQLGLKLQLKPFAGGLTGGEVFLVQGSTPPLQPNLKAGAPEAAQASETWVRDAATRCLQRELDAMVTAPVNKEAIIRAGCAFVGQTELLSEMAGSNRTAMMLLGTDDRGRWLRVALATTHVPLKKVSGSLTQAKIEQVIELAADACHRLGLPRARVGVCGLNPHAGEGGELGTEELTTISPAVAAAQNRNLDVAGPLSADALFHYAYRGDYDVVVAMYHDQGLAPLKMVAFEQGVNWTLGLPFIRTSPDHGTAYDIAGQGRANPSSMQAALKLARQLASGPG